MAYNFLKDARTVKNSELCIHDNLNGYSSDFHENGSVDGWDIYDNIYLYGCWNSVLFGTSYDRECYISRSNIFSIVEAEDYYYIKLMMKITNNSPNVSVTTLTTGRIQWTRLGDSNWTSDKQMDFDIIADNKWRLYTINMGPAQWWQGDITNLRIYPFIDGREKDQFAIKFIKISSLDAFACDNTQCAYYLQYSHPCQGAGRRGTCEAGISKSLYTTVSGVSDGLIVNINGYGEEHFTLGDNSNLTGVEMAKVIANKVSALNTGGYAYSFCEYSELDKLKITSGSVSSSSSVSVSGTAVEALGFYDLGVDISTKLNGIESADGFDYASSRILTALEINKLIDGNSEDFAYIHNPAQYSVEGGRRDFNEMGVSQLLSTLGTQNYYGEYYDSLNNNGRTLIDFSHPFNNNGRITSIYMYGVVDILSKIKILRPHKDGSLTVVHSLDLPLEDNAYIYTTNPIVYRVDCDILVERGDILGIYNANLFVGVSPLNLPEAIFTQVTGDVSGTFTPDDPLSFGVGGFAIYARGDRWQTNTIIDIDLGDRINIEEMNIYGEENIEYFEFNIACCEDVSWEVDLFDQHHQHSGINWSDGLGFTHIHQNIAYGLDCLDDCIRTADNGQVGTSYGKDSDGVWTAGDNHSYFYVNGDAEWLYSWDCSIGKYEYCGKLVPYKTSGYIYDPIAFTLKFPYEFEAEVHKSIVYFKERNNFRDLALSYYLGQHNSLGNADSSEFQYVPEYTSIKLDGLLYDPNNNLVSNPYIFSNPMSSKPIYESGDEDLINWEIVQAAHGTDWTIMEHNFESILCKGFRIYTNHHKSTKITEMEVYSKMSTSPSLTDNVSLSFSDYGDVWISSSFEEVDSYHINTFIGGASRYLTLEFESANEFMLNEIELLVGDQAKTEKCTDIVLLDHAKAGVVNESTPITLENVYDKPFDLYVDIPKETNEADNLIFWSRLGSYDQIAKPEIGPGCKLHKQDDYPIRNNNGQCAINVPAYGLKNLVHNKEAYYNYNGEDYIYWGTITSGTSIDFCNNLYMDMHKSELTFTGVSSKYWKIGTVDVSCDYAVVKDIIAYYNDDRVDITRVYISSTPGSSSQLYGFDSDGTNLPGLPGIIDDFDDATYSGTWTMAGTANSSMVESSSKICVSSYGDVVGVWHGPEMTANLKNDLSDFYLLDHWYIDYDDVYWYDVTLQDSTGTAIITCVVADVYATGTQVSILSIYNKASVKINPNQSMYTPDGVTIPLEIYRYGSSIRVKIDQIDWTGTIDTDAISKVRIRYLKNTGPYQPPTEFCTEYISIDSPPMIYNGSAFGFKLNNTDSVNKIKLIHGDCSINSIDTYVSYDNSNNYAEISNFSVYTWNQGDKHVDLTLSNGDLTVDDDGSNAQKAVRATASKSSGKWYWEWKIDVQTIYSQCVGWCDSTQPLTNQIGRSTIGNGWGVYATLGRLYHNNSYRTVSALIAGALDIYMFALDIDAGKFWIGKNGTWAESGVPASGTNEQWTGVTGDLYPGASTYNSSHKGTANFGATDFQYSVPIGFEGLYVEPTDAELTILNEVTYSRFVIDLEKRHDLDIIRNYGVSDLGWISTSVGTDYSNSVTSDVASVDWGNSGKDDVRWLGVNLINDGTLNCIRKLGIYPDISSVFCQGGGYNCEWYDFGNILSDYIAPLNVAYGATTTGTNYYFSNYYPDNAVDGISTDHRASSCWGFQEVDGTDPYLELDFEQLYLINKVVLYHGYDPRDSAFINTDYTFSVSTTSSGSFTTVFSTSGNSQFERTHQFDAVYARRARLTITGYDSDRQVIGFDIDTGQTVVFDGCYLREIEVYTYTDVGYVDSETWPIVCMDTQGQFNIVGHDVVNKDVTDTDTNWDNDEEFFMYSDNVFDDPQKVSFTQEGEYKTYYQKTDTFTSSDVGITEYFFSSISGVYFDEGRYIIEWDVWADSGLYGSDYPPEEKISLRLDGPSTIDHFANVNTASAWLPQIGDINVPVAGFYSVKGIQHIDATYEWGVRNPNIYRPVGLRKWVAVKRDTAENYSYDDDSGKYGADYLSLLKVYGDEKYNPTEYSWWWTSTLSTLNNDHLKVKTGARSLKISYPTASGVDVVSFIEGDDFGSDAFFESKDVLNFWWYISDITKLDNDYGDVTFGVINNSEPAYYTWTISGTNLITGWNDVSLKFEAADYFYPVIESYSALSDYLDEKLDFRNNGKDLASFRLRYRGKGQSFTMNIDDLKIERNVFADDVKFGKGLCLTGYDYLEIPLSTITLEKGTIEFWTKLYTDTYGRNKFNDFNSRVLFTLVNNNNDIISLGIKSGVWFEPLSGHIRKALNMFDISNSDLPLSAFYDINEVVHLAMVWDSAGSFMGNNDTLRFYINNELICRSKTTWEVEDTKSAILKLGGATTQMALNKDAFGSAILDNVKIYNYCRDTFNIEKEGVEKDVTFTPNEFLQVSPDNVNFYGVGSANLPIIFQAVPAGDTRTVYVRSNKNENFAQSKKTGVILLDWLTSV